MPIAERNGIRLEYSVAGDPAGSPDPARSWASACRPPCGPTSSSSARRSTASGWCCSTIAKRGGSSRLVDQPVPNIPAAMTRALMRTQGARALRPDGHGARCRGGARCGWHRQGACRRRLDGRHDRAGAGGAASGARAQPDLDHVVERQPAAAHSPRQAPCPASAAAPPAGRPRASTASWTTWSTSSA